MLQSARFLGLARDFGLALIRKITWPAPYLYRGGVDNDNWFFPVFVEPQAFLRQKYEDATIAFALEERQLACFGRQPRSGDGHRELERQKQFSPDTMITMK
jgi:hypothetical protein